MRCSPALLLALVAAAACGCGEQADGAGERNDRLGMVKSFAFAIGSGDLRGDPAAVAARYEPFDLAVVDGEEAGRGEVRAMRRSGTLVLAYLSVGTIEPYRSWYRLLRPYRLPSRFEQFGEWYARVNAAGYRRAIAGRIAPRLLAKAFDGLFLDNTDMIETHRRQTPGMRRLVALLSRRVHHDGGFLFSQNGESVIGPMLRRYDGWNREDVTSTYDFESRSYRRVSRAEHAAALAALRRFRDRGLLTLATDYTAANDAGTRRRAVTAACGAGALPFVSNIGLTRIPARPLACS
jgi:polysaccharide biosynthesis protein PelA